MSSVECLIIDTKERLPKASPMIRLKGEASENLKFAVNEKQEHTNRLSRFLVCANTTQRCQRRRLICYTALTKVIG